MRLTKVVCYQAVALPIKTQGNYNTISDDIVPGVSLELVDQTIKIFHKEWNTVVYVPLANVRFFMSDLFNEKSYLDEEVNNRLYPEIETDIKKIEESFVDKMEKTAIHQRRKPGPKPRNK